MLASAGLLARTGRPSTPADHKRVRAEATCRPVLSSSPAGCLRGRPGIAAVDRLLDPISAVRGGEAAIALDRGELVRQFLILDRVTDPGLVIPGAKMVQPGAIVDPGRDLQEQ